MYLRKDFYYAGNCRNFIWYSIFVFGNFYVVLYHIWRERYQIKGCKATTAAIYGLAGLRIVLCMMPQNAWLSAEAPLSWGIYRNIPFALMGLIIIVLFYKSAKENNDSSFSWMWLTIVLSFAFYIPVVLLADVIPMIGMLMIPKTCAYVWTVLIGYNAMKNDWAIFSSFIVTQNKDLCCEGRIWDSQHGKLEPS